MLDQEKRWSSMWDLLMLGIIPGTNIQIDFIGWLKITAIFMVASCVLIYALRHIPANFLWRVSIRNAIRTTKTDFEKAAWAHATTSPTD